MVNGFYYPNLNNDMWRIVGLLFFNNKDYFLNENRKAFCRERITDFLNDKGIALFDTASSIRRLQDNASDKFLEVVQPTDISRLLRLIPECKAIVTTGQKATDTLRTQFEVREPKVGDFSEFVLKDVRCDYTGCLLLHGHTHWHWIKKQELTVSCIKIYKCLI